MQALWPAWNNLYYKKPEFNDNRVYIYKIIKQVKMIELQ